MERNHHLPRMLDAKPDHVSGGRLREQVMGSLIGLPLAGCDRLSCDLKRNRRCVRLRKRRDKQI